LFSTQEFLQNQERTDCTPETRTLWESSDRALACSRFAPGSASEGWRQIIIWFAAWAALCNLCVLCASVVN